MLVSGRSKCKCKLSKMAQWVRALAAKPGDLSFIPLIRVMEGANWHLWSPHVPWCICVCSRACAHTQTHTNALSRCKCKGKYEVLFKLTLSEAGEWPYVPSVSPWGCHHRPTQGGFSTDAIGHYWLQHTFCDNANTCDIFFSICVWDVCDFLMIENKQATKQSTNPDLLSHKASQLLVSQSSSSYLSQCLKTLGFSSAAGPASASFSSVT